MGTGRNIELTLSPGRIDPTNRAFDDSRKPLAAEFAFRGQSLFVINNHFASKGGSSPLFGAVQPPIDGGSGQRRMQAQVVGDFVERILRRHRQANVVVLGDLNDFEFSRPLSILERAGLKNLTNDLRANARWSFIFDGNSQALDHILVSRPLASGASYDIVHVNAAFDEDDQASDHDPALAKLRLR